MVSERFGKHVPVGGPALHGKWAHRPGVAIATEGAVPESLFEAIVTTHVADDTLDHNAASIDPLLNERVEQGAKRFIDHAISILLTAINLHEGTCRKAGVTSRPMHVFISAGLNEMCVRRIERDFGSLLNTQARASVSVFADPTPVFYLGSVKGDDTS
jgi:hypothetical protein